ncbi:hypothetical protein [Nannocystis bainbridge]|uniref:Uncharacterized protein n=1 Tax=Nannocystis bainbridge TaxID=2995303 RepID=A0ABT5DUB1_9BACT|nr:hypothetical protein [Nannocystis bainbridge]MDC0716735.1 hypothetical protein [Nannocystis bainbridge]
MRRWYERNSWIAAALCVAAGLSFGAALRTRDARAYSLDCEDNEYGELHEVRRVAGDGDPSAQVWSGHAVLRLAERTFTTVDDAGNEVLFLHISRDSEP